MVNRILLLLFLLGCTVNGQKLTVGPIGCDFTTLGAALPAALNGYTIEIKNGPVKYTEALSLASKSNILIYSTSTPRDTLDAKIALGDYISFKNITFANDTIKATNKTGNTFKYCKLTNMKLQWERSDTLYVSRGNSISSCTLNNVEVFIEWGRYHIGGVKVDSCIFNNSFLPVAALDTIRCNKFRGTVSVMSIYNTRGANAQIDHNYFNGAGAGGEFVNSNTGEAVKAKNVTFEYNVFDSCNHGPLLCDGWRDSKIRYNTFINSSNYLVAVGNHQEGSKDSSDNVQISNNTFTDGFGTAYGDQRAVLFNNYFNGPQSTRISVKRNLMLDGGTSPKIQIVAFPYPASITDTIADNRWGAEYVTGVIGTGWGTQSNLLYGQKNMTINKYRYPFVKRGSSAILDPVNGTLAGSLSYLINVKTPAFDTLTGFAVRDSVSEQLWYDNPVEKDSGITVLQTATNKSGPWTNRATSLLKKAGSTGVLAATGLVYGTKYFYRLTFVGTSRTENISDTTDVDSIAYEMAFSVKLTKNSRKICIESKPYVDTTKVTGGTEPYIFTIHDSLPPGLSINATTGIISGAIMGIGSRDKYVFMIKVADAANGADSLFDSILVDVKPKVSNLTINKKDSLFCGTLQTKWTAPNVYAVLTCSKFIRLGAAPGTRDPLYGQYPTSLKSIADAAWCYSSKNCLEKRKSVNITNL